MEYMSSESTEKTPNTLTLEEARRTVYKNKLSKSRQKGK